MARPKLKVWLYVVLLKSIFAQDKPVGWRLESVEPNIIRYGDWINLYGLNTEQLITSQETDDEYDENFETILWPGIKISFVQNDLTGIVTNEVECNTPYLIWTDEFFPQQDFLRVPYGIKCKVESETNQDYGRFKVKMLIPIESGAIVDESDGLETDHDADYNDADWTAEAEFLVLDSETNVTDTEFKVYETNVFVTIESEYQSLDEMLSELRNTPSEEPPRMARMMPSEAAEKPSITKVVPNYGSPRGGQVITIVGNNLVSQVLDIGTEDTSAEGQGESYNIWFEMSGYSPVKCVLDRMLNLLAREVGKHNGIYCKTQQVPRQGDWRLKLQIDGSSNPIIDGGNFAFRRQHAATIEHIFNAPSAPAQDPNETFRQRAWWTEWSDNDQKDDGTEYEDLVYHRMNKNCLNPIDMEVWDKINDEQFFGSKDFSGDGKPSPERWNLYEGFRCTTKLQTFLENGQRPRCNNYKVRYLCLDGVVDLQGRIYTTFFDRVESKLDNDANRLQMLPTLTSEDGLKMGECNLFLKEDDGLTELDLPRVKASGDNGFIRCLANATEPGLYNITYNTQNQGDSMPHPRLYSHFQNEDLTPFNFEVYPQVRSVHPRVGSMDGGTKITITGTGFRTTFGGEDRRTKVEVGGVECLIESVTAIEIICQTQMTDELKNKVLDMDQVRLDRFELIKGSQKNNTACPGNDIDSEFDVPSLKECMRRCAQMHYCRAVSYTPWANSKRCSYKRACSNFEAKQGVHIAFMDGTTLAADKLKRKTRTCFYGNGEGYIGDVSQTATGEKCSSPCRNPDGAWSVPKCPTISTSEQKDCAIVRCEKAFGNHFTGSRGLLVDFRKATFTDDYIAVSEAYNGLHVSDSTFVQKGQSKWYSGRADYDNYSGRMRFIFIAPQDGAFRFLVAADDWYALYWMKPDGTYVRLCRGKEWTGYEDYQKYHWKQQSRTFNLKAGEEVPLMMVYEEGHSSDYGTVGVQYLGKGWNGAEGTRFDERKSESRYKELDDRYIKEDSEWKFRSTPTEQRQRIFFSYDFAGITWNNQTGAFPGDRKLPPVFRLEFCNELGDCRVTNNNLVIHGWDKTSNADRETYIAKQILYRFYPVCSYSDGGNPDSWPYKYYHTGFESDSIWPGANWQKINNGRFCNRKAFRCTQGNFIFHWNSLKNHVGGKHWRIYSASVLNPVAPHLCMAVQGSIAHMQANIKAWTLAGKEIKGWNWINQQNNPHFTYLSPGGGYEWGYKCFNMQHVIDHWAARTNTKGCNQIHNFLIKSHHYIHWGAQNLFENVQRLIQIEISSFMK